MVYIITLTKVGNEELRMFVKCDDIVLGFFIIKVEIS